MIDFSIKDTVFRLLTDYPHLRDSDTRLIANIYKLESEGVNDKMLFLKMFAENKLTSPESIRRMRQKLQEDNPGLRGKTYEKRHKKQEQIKQSLGYAV